MESMNADVITFREATPEDTPVLAELAARSFREAYHHLWEAAALNDYISRAFAPEQIGAELLDPNTTFVLLSRDSQPAGYAKLRRGHNPPDFDGVAAVQIQRFYLLAAHYGRGLGDALMEHCLATARQQGFATVWLAVWPENTRAVKFYERWGFAVTGSYPFYHGNEVAQDWLMSRDERQET
ncbi:MAG TPA: N-acetyltransferase [Cytophagales bacterium]|jgi:ribosomal protein S18 acetylase RimI-like enzyme